MKAQFWIDRLKGIQKTLGIIYFRELAYTDTYPNLCFIRLLGECLVPKEVLLSSKPAPMPWGNNYQN